MFTVSFNLDNASAIPNIAHHQAQLANYEWYVAGFIPHDKLIDASVQNSGLPQALRLPDWVNKNPDDNFTLKQTCFFHLAKTCRKLLRKTLPADLEGLALTYGLEFSFSQSP